MRTSRETHVPSLKVILPEIHISQRLNKPFPSLFHFSKFQSGRRRTTLWMCYFQIIILSKFALCLFSYEPSRRRHDVVRTPIANLPLTL